jgi:hypothetical protein
MQVESPPPNCNWLRFRVTTLLLVMFVLSLPLSWFGRQYNTGRETATRIREIGGVPVRSMNWDHRWGQVIGANFQGAKITDNDLMLLKPMTALSWINLEKTKITDAGLAHLVELPRLRMIFLSDTALTDEGLQYLEELPDLEFLQAHRTNITSDGVDRLKQSHPGLDAYWLAK